MKKKHSRVKSLELKVQQQTKTIREYREKEEIVYCSECQTYTEDLEGAIEPDFEGYCTSCGSRDQWETVSILDIDKEEMLSALNDGVLTL